jgi:hypothetical protein
VRENDEDRDIIINNLYFMIILKYIINSIQKVWGSDISLPQRHTCTTAPGRSK